VFLNGNAVALSKDGKSEEPWSKSGPKCGCGGGPSDPAGPSAQGGNTPVWSGDAYGGNGGNASANGGDAASGIAFVKQEGAPAVDPCGCPSKGGPHSEGGVEQKDNTATGGDGGTATGGNGGDANSGNFVAGNGNAIALSKDGGSEEPWSKSSPKCGCGGGPSDPAGPSAQGGYTPVWSGDATGGNGGNAYANGGDAASGIAVVEQAPPAEEGSGPSEYHYGGLAA
jgi:hypothetical protein